MVALRSILAACGALAVLSSSVALAQSTVPNIVGHWDAVAGSGAIYGGELFDSPAGPSGTVFIEITGQTGYAFVGTYNWDTPSDEEPLTHDGTEHTHQASEDIVGVFRGDGASFVMAEHPDTGMMFGRMLDDHRLEVIVAESEEHAIVIREVYERR
ncbi:MAG: hypothetical protein AAF414_09375 [Pseudomonadota bacterium]